MSSQFQRIEQEFPVGDVRVQAAKAARELIEAARREQDIKEMIAAVCARTGHTSIIDLAGAEPADVVALAEEVLSLDEQDFES